MDNNWLQRGEVLLGGDKQERLAGAHVMVVGLGGVGSWAAEMLCRAGVGEFTIIDADKVDVTNVNRQMPALSSTVGLAKCEVVAARLRDINPAVRLSVENVFVDENNLEQLFAGRDYAFVVDAIDSLPSKAALIKYCWEKGIKIVSSMGAGAKMNLADIKHGDLWKTEHCTLAKNLRRLLRDCRGVYKLPVVYSCEPPRAEAVKPNPQGGKPLIGSLGYFTATFGCYLAEYVIKEI